MKGMLTILLALSLVGCQVEKQPVKETTTKEVKTVSNKESVKDLIVFSNFTLNQDEKTATLMGEIKNTDTTFHNFFYQVTFYGKDNKIIDTDTNAVYELESGKNQTFKVKIDTKEKVENYKCQVTTVAK
jgi:hypothetical protein